MDLIISPETGMYLLAASEVPLLRAKYLILPGQVMLDLPS